MTCSYPTSVPAAYAAYADAYRTGWNHGHGIACHNVPELGATLWVDAIGRVTVDADNIREIHEAACFEAESNARSYSPWERIAHAFNEAEESEDLWEAYEAGVADAIAADVATYTDEDYGITEEAE
jgi:hypothetical protein